MIPYCSICGKEDHSLGFNEDGICIHVCAECEKEDDEDSSESEFWVQQNIMREIDIAEMVVYDHEQPMTEAVMSEEDIEIDGPKLINVGGTP